MSGWEDERGPEESFFWQEEAADRTPGRSVAVGRLDTLLPLDAETGAVTPAALRVCLNAMMELTARHGHPLALLAVGVDTAEESQNILHRFGLGGAGLIGRAVVRCLRQETRLSDIVGLCAPGDLFAMPAFLVACPMMTEAQAVRLAERLREAMAHPAGSGQTWFAARIGVAETTLETMEPEALLSHAMAALHRARTVAANGIWSHSDTLRRIIEHGEHDAE